MGIFMEMEIEILNLLFFFYDGVGYDNGIRKLIFFLVNNGRDNFFKKGGESIEVTAR